MLFASYRPRESQDKLGLPTYIARTFTEEFNEKDPMQGIYSGNWHRYNRYQNGVAVPEELRLPPKLIMVCKGAKRFVPDLYIDEIREWIISAQLLTFFKDHQLLEGQYEESELTLMSTGKKAITDKQYYLLRLFANNNDLIDFEQTPKIVSPKKPLTKHTPPTVYYPELVFRHGVTIPPLFFLDDPSYWYSFICNEAIKIAMEQAGFKGFEFYTLEDYVQERLYREKYPQGPPSDQPKRLS